MSNTIKNRKKYLYENMNNFHRSYVFKESLIKNPLSFSPRAFMKENDSFNFEPENANKLSSMAPSFYGNNSHINISIPAPFLKKKTDFFGL